MISDWIKSEATSLSVKVRVAVWPDFKAEVEELIVMVGAMVSTVIEIVLAALLLLLPAASVKVFASTLKVAVAVLLLVGVKVAV